MVSRLGNLRAVVRKVSAGHVRVRSWAREGALKDSVNPKLGVVLPGPTVDQEDHAGISH